MSRSPSDSQVISQTPQFILDAIPLLLSRHNIMFSKTVAAKLVGGRGKLGKLIEQGKVRVDKKAAKQNGKWYCNAGDIFRHLKI